ncbi:hypothetical protein SNE40_001612 [Patella caerulea]|uniref:Uncharacterized protein n=1 Tax=Patella caerulea TaxID=87958 RepID=A0AAN8QBC4_PATCE
MSYKVKLHDIFKVPEHIVRFHPQQCEINEDETETVTTNNGDINEYQPLSQPVPALPVTPPLPEVPVELTTPDSDMTETFKPSTAEIEVTSLPNNQSIPPRPQRFRRPPTYLKDYET